MVLAFIGGHEIGRSAVMEGKKLAVLLLHEPIRDEKGLVVTRAPRRVQELRRWDHDLPVLFDVGHRLYQLVVC